MSRFIGRTAATLIAAALALGTAAPAFAGECPTGKAGNNALTGAPTMPKGVTDDVVGMIDLAPEVMFKGYDLRVRKLVVQPGGIVPLHSHSGRPALILTATGTIKEYNNRCTVPVVHMAGEVARETNGLTHYWVNEGSETVVLYSSDVKSMK